jgi:hypothetical protein
MMLTRNCEIGNQVLAACSLFDCRVFRWRLRDEWLRPEVRAAGPVPEGQQDQEDLDPAFKLHHCYSTPDNAPIVDLSISSTARRIYVVGMENVFLLSLDGVPLMVVRTARWRGEISREERRKKGKTWDE